MHKDGFLTHHELTEALMELKDPKSPALSQSQSAPRGHGEWWSDARGLGCGGDGNEAQFNGFHHYGSESGLVDRVWEEAGSFREEENAVKREEK